MTSAGDAGLEGSRKVGRSAFCAKSCRKMPGYMIEAGEIEQSLTRGEILRPTRLTEKGNTGSHSVWVTSQWLCWRSQIAIGDKRAHE